MPTETPDNYSYVDFSFNGQLGAVLQARRPAMVSKKIPRYFILGLLGVAGGCTTSNNEQAPPVGSTTMWFGPGFDGTTAYGDRPYVMFDRTVDISPVAPVLSLMIYPEMTVVLADVIQHPSSGANPTIELVPKVPLTDRWYAIAVASIPKGFKFADGAQAPVAMGSGWGVRFRTGSDPRLLGWSLCNHVGKPVSVGIRFSEQVVANLPVSKVVQVSQGQTMCTPDDDALTAPGRNGISFSCPVMTTTLAADVTVSPGFSSSTSMKQLEMGNMITKRLDPMMGTAVGDCRYFPAPLNL